MIKQNLINELSQIIEGYVDEDTKEAAKEDVANLINQECMDENDVDRFKNNIRLSIFDENNEEQIIQVPAWAEDGDEELIDLTGWQIEQDSKRVPKLIKDTINKLEGEDRLAELEVIVRDYFVKTKNKKLDGSWCFHVSISASYKCKSLTVSYFDDIRDKPNIIFTRTFETTKDMFDKAFEFFKMESKDGK